MAQPGAMPGAVPPLQPGQQPTPAQIQAMQQQFFAEAAKRGLTPQQFGEQLKAQALAQQQAARQGGQGGPPGAGAGAQGQAAAGQAPGGTQVQMPVRGQQVPIQPGPPKPEALAVASFLRSQNLKSRECVFEQQRKELFKGMNSSDISNSVKRAIRAIQSPAYEKARSKKGSLLPPVTDRASAENVFKLLPISMLALRVSKIDPADNPTHGEPGHQHAGGKKTKGKKGVWNVKIEPQQEADDYNHYIWFYEGSQWKQKLYAGGALMGVIAAVMFPLWPYTLRIGVWYLSMGALGLLVAFFGLAIVRLIFFLVSIAAFPPGIWIYPNLFEDVGFFDSFKPAWAWRETKESLAEKKRIKKEKKLSRQNRLAGKPANGAVKAAVKSTSSETVPPTGKKGGASTSASTASTAPAGQLLRRTKAPTVEDVDDE